jgi:uncharacterized protein YggE
MKKKLLILLSGIVILVLVSVGLAGCQATGSSVENSNQQVGISVSGEGKVTVTPDIVNVQYGIQAQALTVADAQSQAANAINDVMAALTANGVAQIDIQTQSYSIQQTTSWDNNKQIQIVTGYQVNNYVNIKIRDVAKAGIIIDAAAAAGGNLTRVNSIQFGIADPLAYNDQVREKAMTDAKDTATQLAKLAGVTLGKPISISENVSSPVVPPIYYNGAADAKSSTAITPGTFDITMTVQVLYAIK